MKRRNIFPMSLDDLEKLPTKRLLVRLKGLQQCEQSFDLSDRDEYEKNMDSSVIEFKETLEWQNEHNKLKIILNKREHIS